MSIAKTGVFCNDAHGIFYAKIDLTNEEDFRANSSNECVRSIVSRVSLAAREYLKANIVETITEFALFSIALYFTPALVSLLPLYATAALVVKATVCVWLGREAIRKGVELLLTGVILCNDGEGLSD